MGLEGAFVWHELVTSDTAAAAEFYSAVVGWNSEKAPNSTADGAAYHVFNIPGFEMGTAGMMELKPEMIAGGARPGWIGYIGANDVDAKAAEIAANGGALHMAPTDIPGIGRFAVAADPHGAMFYVFKPNMPDGPLPDMPTYGTPGTIGWNELLAGDGEEAVAFYTKLFGWKPTTAMDMGAMGVYQLFSHDGTDIGAIMTKTPDIPAPFWNYYFMVPALDPATAILTEKGGKVLMGPHEVPGPMYVVQALDPQGAMFSLVAPKR
jgi:uncharacterized protein